MYLFNVQGSLQSARSEEYTYKLVYKQKAFIMQNTLYKPRTPQIFHSSHKKCINVTPPTFTSVFISSSLCSYECPRYKNIKFIRYFDSLAK